VPQSSASGMPIRPGNVGKNSLSAPGAWNFDLSIAKGVRIVERVGLQVRAEMFNAFNHPNLGGPERELTRTTFGGILGVSGPRSFQMSLKLTF